MVAAPNVGDVVAGKYRLESVLGRGGMGIVYAARHAISERRVAVKWMEADLASEPDALERFVREARAMGRIEHPNVVGVLDVGTEPPIAYLVMELLRGESLRAMIEREGRIEASLAVRTLLPVMEGVEAAHRAGVVHRDLKPENLFVVKDATDRVMTTKVLDFGISKLTETDSKRRDSPKLTKTGHVVGTPTYMSPEQVRGALIDARSDVWSLSVILYEMLSGRTPFDAESYGALLVAIAVEPYVPLDPSVVPPNLARIVHRGLAKDPADRWPTVMDLARALEPFANGATFHEPHRRSVVPGAPPEAERTTRPSKLDPSKTPAQLELESGATRAAPQIAAAERPASDVPMDTSSSVRAAGLGPERRWMTIAAIAVAVVVGLVVVIRTLGNASREASADAPPPTSVVPSIAAPAPPRPSVAPTTVAAPPPTPLPTTIPMPSVVAAPSTRVHHDPVRPRPTTAPTTTADPPRTATGTSRSGSISRDEF
jgi:serine/threonine-protein kinase